MRYNKAIFGGNLGADAILRNKDESVFTTFRLASSDPTGETLWIDCLLRGVQAKRLHEYLKKGTGVIVDGRLALREYRTRTGELKSTLYLLVDNLEFAWNGKKRDTEPESAGSDIGSGDLPF